MRLKKDQLRKQIRFRSKEELQAINLAVKIIGDNLTQGERVTFSSFIRAAATNAAVEVIKNNPDHMKPKKEG